MQKGRDRSGSRPFLTFALREAWVYLLVRFYPMGGKSKPMAPRSTFCHGAPE
jgi:hypothetical protein